MEIVRTIARMQEVSRTLQRQGRTIGFVPTMGALHSGHLSLVDLAGANSDVVVVSIFVNPMQFGPKEDFERYPRNEGQDCAMLADRGVEFLFMPAVDEMYPKGFETVIELSRLPRHLCGLRRESHFSGVTTVVLKLFSAVCPDVSVFGEKDYQQLMVIRKMVRDLNLPVRVLAGPTVREADGLALSSRNAYLTPDERNQAGSIFEALKRARQLVTSGVVDTIILRRSMTELLERTGAAVDYVAIIDPETLEELQTVKDRAHAAVAAYFGRTRLIDNLRLKG